MNDKGLTSEEQVAKILEMSAQLRAAHKQEVLNARQKNIVWSDPKTFEVIASGVFPNEASMGIIKVGLSDTAEVSQYFLPFQYLGNKIPVDAAIVDDAIKYVEEHAVDSSIQTDAPDSFIIVFYDSPTKNMAPFAWLYASSTYQAFVLPKQNLVVIETEQLSRINGKLFELVESLYILAAHRLLGNKKNIQ